MFSNKAKNKCSKYQMNNGRITTRRRIITYFTVFTLLFQTSVPVIAGILNNTEIEDNLSALSSILPADENSSYLYLADSFVEASTHPTKNLETFFSGLKGNHPVIVSNVTDENPVKFLGSPAIQNLFIRAQLYDLLGRHLIDPTQYSTEAIQTSVLYSNATTFLLANPVMRFGDKLSEYQFDINFNSSGKGKSMIFPELREITDLSGNIHNVIVPIVYLTWSTVEDRKVKDHQIEFNGIATFGDIIIDGVTVHTGRDGFIKARNDLRINGGGVNSEHDVHIQVEGTFHNLSGLVQGNEGVTIIADHIQNETIVHRYDFGGEKSTLYGEIASINSESGSVLLDSHDNILNLGAEVSAGEKIEFKADGDILIGAQSLYSLNSHLFDVDEVWDVFDSHKWNSNYERIDYLGSTLSAGDAIELTSAGEILVKASDIVSSRGHIDLLASLGITVENEFYSFNYNGSAKWGDWGGRVTENESAYRTFAIRSFLEAGQGISLHTASGDITLKGVHIESEDGTLAQSDAGRVQVLVTETSDEYSYNASRQNDLYSESYQEGFSRTGVELPTIIGGLKAQALLGVEIEFKGDPSLPLNEQVQALSQYEGLAWMAEQLAESEANPELYNWVAIKEKHKEWKEENVALSPAVMAVIVITISVAAGPAGGAIATGLGTVGSLAAAISAGAVSLISQASLAVINGTLNGGINGIGDALDDLVSDELVKSLAIAMVTAGALAEIDARLFTPDPDKVEAAKTAALAEAQGKVPPLSLDEINQQVAQAEQNLHALSWSMQAAQEVTHASVRAGVQTMVHGGDFDGFVETFQQSLLQSGINKVGKYMANEIKGQWDGPQATNLDTTLRYIAHAGAGCLLGLAQANLEGDESSADCKYGALGAVTGELIADVHKSNAEIASDVEKLESFMAEQGLTDTSQMTFEKKKQLRNMDITATASQLQDLSREGIDLAKLGGALSAFVAGADASQIQIASLTAENAAENNGLFLIPIAIFLLKSIDLALTANEFHEMYELYQKNPGEGKKALIKYFGESVALKIVEKLLPGATTFKVFIKKLGENDVIPEKLANKINNTTKKVNDNVTLKDPVTPANSGSVGKTKGKEGSSDIALDGGMELAAKKNIQNLHLAAIKETDPVKKNAIYQQIGVDTEMLTEMVLARNGMVNLGDLKYGGGSNNGIDHVFKKIDTDGTEHIFIVDSKQLTDGSFKLGNTNSGVQLSDKWVAKVLTETPDSNVRKLVDNALKKGTLRRAVTGLDKATGEFVMTEIKWPST